MVPMAENSVLFQRVLSILGPATAEGRLVWVGRGSGGWDMPVSLSRTSYLCVWLCFSGAAVAGTLRCARSPRRKYSSWRVWTRPTTGSSRSSSLW